MVYGVFIDVICDDLPLLDAVDLPRLPVIERLELMDAVFDVCLYHAPDNISLPAGYTAPSLAISKLYWKGWLLLLVIASFNPSSVGMCLFFTGGGCLFFTCVGCLNMVGA